MKIAATWHCMLIALLFGGVSVVAGAESAAWRPSVFLVESFVEVALRSNYSARQHPVRKWSGPVNYFIVQQVGDEDLHRTMVSSHFEHLAKITGLPIRPASVQAAANFLVVLTSEDRLEAELPRYLGTGPAHQSKFSMHQTLCLANFVTDRKGAIVRAVAMIPADAARAGGQLASCVVEELTHAMGLSNDSLKDFPSIFSRTSGYSFLSGLDYLMLKMLYDPRVKVGMSERTVLGILHAIASEYERDRRFETAEKIAVESGLSGLNP